jgi:hypothetical protein
MNWPTVLSFVNLFFGGILAGIEIAVHYGFVMPRGLLTEGVQVRLRQSLVLRLRVLVPAFFVPTVLSGTAVAFLDGAGPGFRVRCAGMIAMSIWIAVRGIATVRINSATLTWNPESPPQNWRASVEHAEHFHIAGVWAAVVAFASFLVAAALSQTAR